MTARILIVGPPDATRQGWRDTLRGHYYRVSETATCAGARVLLPRLRPDLVLIAAALSDGPGGALCQWIRRSGQGGVAVVLEAGTGADATAAAFAAGAEDVVCPPVAPRALSMRIRRVLRDREALQTLGLGAAGLAPAACAP
ncbi:MAG: response regulator, partial [Pseudomonadota bacterium]